MKNELVDRIANGNATLLGVDDICKRLGVSRSTFERWVRNGSSKLEQSAGETGFGNPPTIARAHSLIDSESALSFPPPDIRIGNSPKWELDTLKRWLLANTSSGTK